MSTIEETRPCDSLPAEPGFGLVYVGDTRAESEIAVIMLEAIAKMCGLERSSPPEIRAQMMDCLRWHAARHRVSALFGRFRYHSAAELALAVGRDFSAPHITGAINPELLPATGPLGTCYQNAHEAVNDALKKRIKGRRVFDDALYAEGFYSDDGVSIYHHAFTRLRYRGKWYTFDASPGEHAKFSYHGVTFSREQVLATEAMFRARGEKWNSMMITEDYQLRSALAHGAQPFASINQRGF